MELTDFLEYLEKEKVGIDDKTARMYLSRLYDKRLVEKPERGRYTLPDKLFREYVLRVSKAER